MNINEYFREYTSKKNTVIGMHNDFQENNQMQNDFEENNTEFKRRTAICLATIDFTEWNKQRQKEKKYHYELH